MVCIYIEWCILLASLALTHSKSYRAGFEILLGEVHAHQRFLLLRRNRIFAGRSPPRGRRQAEELQVRQPNRRVRVCRPGGE